MRLFYVLTCVLCLFLIRDAWCIKISSVEIPPVVVITEERPENILLKCNYDLENDDSAIVVKWYKDDRAVYQWIRGRSPAVFPPYKELVDSSVEVSSDPDHKYSGLALINMGINSTGNYKCVVQSARATSMEEQRMQIIDIGDHKLEVQKKELLNETLVECRVENVYPKPNVQITYQQNEIDLPLSIDSTTVNQDDNGFYSVRSVAVIDEVSEVAEMYACTANFMENNFNLTAYTNSPSSKIFFAKILLILLFFV